MLHAEELFDPPRQENCRAPRPILKDDHIWLEKIPQPIDSQKRKPWHALIQQRLGRSKRRKPGVKESRGPQIINEKIRKVKNIEKRPEGFLDFQFQLPTQSSRPMCKECLGSHQRLKQEQQYVLGSHGRKIKSRTWRKKCRETL